MEMVNFLKTAPRKGVFPKAIVDAVYKKRNLIDYVLVNNLLLRIPFATAFLYLAGSKKNCSNPFINI